LSARTLASRVARFQTTVVASALVVVLGMTTFVIDRLLTWKTDQELTSVIERAQDYVAQATPTEPDWQWLRGEIEEIRPPDVRIEVRDKQGAMRVSAGPERAPAARAGSCSTDGGVRGCTRQHAGFVFSVARNVTSDRAIVWQICAALAATCVAVGVAVALGSGRITRRALNPLAELASRVQAVEPGTGQRVHLSTHFSELDSVSNRFDDLIERFEAALSREKRFSAEASHELRTPLTVLRGEIEELLAGSKADPERAASAVSSIDRLTALVEALLWFARAQGRLESERLEIVNLADVIRTETEFMGRVRPKQRFDLELPDEALVRGDEELLRRALANLLDNAVKHGDGTQIDISLGRTGDSLALRVANGGQSIPPDVREQIFQPFFRPPHATAHAPGFGLGLPFARAVARSHGGDVVHGPTAAERVVMLLSLPLVEWNDGMGRGV
jgi:signal transduction histidine kinase